MQDNAERAARKVERTITLEMKVTVQVDLEMGEDGIDPVAFSALDMVTAAVRDNQDSLRVFIGDLADSIEVPTAIHVGDVRLIDGIDAK